MTEVEQLRLDVLHLTRRLEGRAEEFSTGRHTAQIMRAKEAMVRAQEGERRALRRNGELLARLALLEQIIEGCTDDDTQQQRCSPAAPCGPDRALSPPRMEVTSQGLNARAMGSAVGGGA